MNNQNNAGTYSNPITASAPAMPPAAIERKISPEIWSVMTTSLHVGARPESILAYWDYCAARRLDPLKKPAHIVPMKVGDVWRDVIMPGIYELRTTAQRTGEYIGQDAPEFGPMGKWGGVEAPEWCSVTVQRMQHGEARSYTHVAFFVEECARKGDGSINKMWTGRPRGQLAKVAEAGALRKAFPEEMGGEMTAEEMHSKGVTIDAEPEPTPEAKDQTDTSVTLAVGPDGEAFDRSALLQIASKCESDDDLAFLSSLVNQIQDPREKLNIGSKLTDASRRVREAGA